MATSVTTVTGFFEASNDQPITEGTVTFTLTNYALDAGEEEVVLKRTATAEIQPDGTFEIDVWPNTEGLASTSYAVSVTTIEGASDVVQAFPNLQVPDLVNPVDFFDLLAAVTVPANTNLVVVADDTEFDATTAGAGEWVVLYVP